MARICGYGPRLAPGVHCAHDEMHESAMITLRVCVDLAGVSMANNDSFVVIAGCRVVIAPSPIKNFNSQNAQKCLDAIGVLSLDGEDKFFLVSFQFSVFSFQRDGEDDPVDHDQSVRHATARRTAECDRDTLRIVPSEIAQSDADALLALGIYKANGRETLRGYVTVPIRDAEGTMICIRGHKVDRQTGNGDIECFRERRMKSFVLVSVARCNHSAIGMLLDVGNPHRGLHDLAKLCFRFMIEISARLLVANLAR